MHNKGQKQHYSTPMCNIKFTENVTQYTKKPFFATLAYLILTFLLVSACRTGEKLTECINPLTYTDIPDNDWIRVGDDYYMVSTTMYFCPGAPIMHSKDLVHWEIVSYVYDCLEDDDVYNLRNGKNAYGRGQWATSLRYENGTFYALFIANDQGKTYIYKTNDIRSSHWERSVINRPFHDASMLFENGHLYIVWGNGDLRIIELEPDGSGIKTGAEEKVLISAPKEGYGLRAEGSHFYHIGDYYYLLEINWPIGGPRTERCWRSKELFGEYESKVILSGPFDGRGDGVAQGGIIQTQKGDWYAIMFQDHGAVGRIPTLQPVTWIEDWPILGENTIPVKQFSVNLSENGKNRVWANDEFDYDSEDKLDLVWQWNHKPDNALWSTTERQGWLRLKTGHLAEDIMHARNTLTQRTVGPRCISEVKLDASGMKPGDRAGLCAFQSNYCRIGVEVAEDGNKYLVGINRVPPERHMKHKQPEESENNGEREVFRMKLEQNEVWLRIRYVFTPQEDDTIGPDMAFMNWSTDGMHWTEISEGLQMKYTLDLFTGYRSALYNYSTSETGGYADFDYFHQQTY